MGLDISRIKNAELRRLAYAADTDDTIGILSKEEFELFKKEAIKRTDISAEDFNQAIGLYITNSSAVTEAAADTTRQVEVTTDAKTKTQIVNLINEKKEQKYALSQELHKIPPEKTKADYVVVPTFAGLASMGGMIAGTGLVANHIKNSVFLGLDAAIHRGIPLGLVVGAVVTTVTGIMSYNAYKNRSDEEKQQALQREVYKNKISQLSEEINQLYQKLSEM